MDEQRLIYIAGIIAKSFRGDLTEEEAIALEDWKNSSPEHPALLEKLSRYSFLEAKLVAEQLSDKAKAYRQFCQQQQDYRRRRMVRRWTYACVAAVAVLVTVAAVLILRPAQHPATVVVAQEGLPAGKNQAILTLADGRRMNLEEPVADTLLQHEGLVMDATAGRIEYRPTENPVGESGYNQLDIPRKGEYRLILADGTKVWLNAETRLRYPVTFQGTERRVYLQGEAYFEVQRNEQMPFIVETGTSAVRVLGTSFNVRAYADEENIYTTLEEGSVRLSSETETLLLRPDEQGVIQTASGTIRKQKVNTALYTSWKDGRFIFENQTLEEIMHTLVRWYDVSIFYTNDRVKEAMFNGNLKRYDNFEQIVEMLEMTGVAHFKINGSTIIISE